VASAPTALPQQGIRVRIAALPAAAWLTALVATSFVLRLLVAGGHRVPRLFPDEYIYATVGRSLSHGELSIRGESASFPALLEPLLAAPLWRLAGDDVQLGYDLVQAMHAFAVSLVAIPVYLIARRVGQSRSGALVSAAFALVLPVAIFATYITADVVAWPLALAALAVGVVCLDRPTRWRQVGFVTLAGLATLARVQYVILPLAFLVAALVLSRGSVRRVLSDYRLTLALLLAPLVAVLVAGPQKLLGYYRGVVDLHVDPSAIAHWLALDGMMLVYALGVVLVPGALVGLALGVVRPRTRAEAAFATLTSCFAALLLVEAAVYASNGSERFQERYLVALLPLAPIAFGIGVARLRDRGSRSAVAALAAGVFLLASLVPLAEYTVLFQKQDSPTLQAVAFLGSHVGTGNASLIVALCACALAVLAAVGAWRPHVATTLASIGVFAAMLAATAGAVGYDRDLSANVERTFVERDNPSWVDNAGLGRVVVLQTPFTSRQQVSQQLFWNQSLVELLRMSDASEVDAYGSTPVTVARDGTILADGKPVTRPVLVEEYASWARLDGARLVHRTINAALWEPRTAVRFSELLAGRYFDGWLGARTTLTVWPSRDGSRHVVASMLLSLPDGIGPVTLDVLQPSQPARSVTVNPGEKRLLRLRVEAARPVRIALRPRQPLLLQDGRLVSLMSSVPHVVEAPNGA
jgi:4-amino-4-deoxy-L-arabinose transferase-like glycosyltransferase